MKTDYFNDQLENKALLVKPTEGKRYEIGSNSFTFKITSEISNDQLGVYEIVLAPMSIGAKLHYHRFMDETFIVIKGVLTFETADGEFQAEEGAVAYAPRFSPHGFRNDTNEEVKLMLIFNPSSKREGFFSGLHETLNEVPINPEKYLKLYNKYDSFPVDTSNMIPVRE
ncbi:cupin domain-containing protein [Aurantibacter crassamenti]|uniref:cupin domain-containing protein n=1 Tax=Aurantibacter crassamenti TaxID=1837375 RepID=UPI00193A6A3F|nr:cupin domain-containing protein [Aurantibacter crassamenti]MBM1107034.1 cupin domain-containing protein [Aurantibacter crassamenti]